MNITIVGWGDTTEGFHVIIGDHESMDQYHPDGTSVWTAIQSAITSHMEAIVPPSAPVVVPEPVAEPVVAAAPEPEPFSMAHAEELPPSPEPKHHGKKKS